MAGAIAAAVIGILAGLASVGVVFVHVKKQEQGKEKEKKKETEKEQVERKESANGKVQAPNTWLRLTPIVQEGGNSSGNTNIRMSTHFLTHSFSLMHTHSLSLRHTLSFACVVGCVSELILILLFI